ncbi:hypothetical protein D4764_16G0000270, partial [Takifugu flavidus]
RLSVRLQMAGRGWEDWFEREEFIGQISDMRVQNLQVVYLSIHPSLQWSVPPVICATSGPSLQWSIPPTICPSSGPSLQ